MKELVSTYPVATEIPIAWGDMDAISKNPGDLIFQLVDIGIDTDQNFKVRCYHHNLITIVCDSVLGRI